MAGKRHILFVPILLLLCSGCSSTRFTTTLVPPKNAENPYPVKFRIESVAYTPAERFSLQDLSGVVSYKTLAMEGDICLRPAGPIDPQKVKRRIAERAVKMYPQVFSEDSASIPLHVDIDVKNRSLFSWTQLVGVPLAFCGIPFPTDIGSADFTVCCHIAENSFFSYMVTFSRKDWQWATITTPLGLISIPGKSDRPKISANSNKVPQTQAELTLGNLVDATVLSLQSKDWSAEIEEYIKSQRKF